MTTPGNPVAPRQTTSGPIGRSHSVWLGGMRFESGTGKRVHEIDGESKTAPSPVETLLNAVGTCSGSDVVDFLTKRRTPVSRMEVDVAATRRGEHPRRVTSIEVTFRIDGEGIEPDQAERAIHLSFERYCTVAASLAADIPITSVLVLNGREHQPVAQPTFSATL